MTTPRTYGDPCGIARALDAIGERWAILIVRELLYGPKRFSDLRVALGMSPNVLSQRLSELEQCGVVERRQAGIAVYELTPWGNELRPILLALGRWGARSGNTIRGELSVDALMAALEATFIPQNAQKFTAVYELHLGDERFALTVDDASLLIRRGHAHNPDAIIDTDASTLRKLVFGDLNLASAQIQIQGDRARARALFRLFARPLVRTTE